MIVAVIFIILIHGFSLGTHLGDFSVKCLVMLHIRLFFNVPSVKFRCELLVLMRVCLKGPLRVPSFLALV